MNLKLNGWDYCISDYNNNENKLPLLSVIPDKDYVVPKSLSKYYVLNFNSAMAFINNKFYVSQPDDFNDLFDFNLNLIDFSGLSFSEINVLASNERERLEFYRKFRDDKINFLEEIRNSLYASWISNFGILCMTKDKYNDLLWAHYTNNRGFLVEFDFENFGDNFLGPYPINYLSEVKPIDFSKIDKSLGFFVTSLIKKEPWKYEDEFRFFCLPDMKKCFKVSGRFSNAEFNFNSQERLISYSSASVIKIILGFNFYFGEETETVGQFEYKLRFRSKDALIKTALFNKVIQENFSIELCVMDSYNLNLSSIPLEICHLGGTTYKIKEIRH